MKLVIKDLSKTYSNGIQALKNVSLTLNNGLFGLLGPNGAGKSSLMRTIATLQEADSGEVFLDGLNVLKNKTEVRQLLGYLPQEFGVYPKISAGRMLDHIARLKGIDHPANRRALVTSLLDKVNLSGHRNKNLGTYSGGMKQRFGIAQALIGDPRLIIVDEPTAGLDPAERNRFYNVLSELGEQTIVILSTHIVEDVNTLCSSFAIINQGEVLFAGDPEQAVGLMQGNVFGKIIDKTELTQYQQTFKVLSSQLKNGKLHIRIYHPCSPENGFAPVETSLEDVYFHHIQHQHHVYKNISV